MNHPSQVGRKGHRILDFLFVIVVALWTFQVSAMSSPKTFSPELRNYLLTSSLRETELLAQLREETQTMLGAIMQIPPEQGQFMSFLVKLIDARRAIEVGVFTGYSTLAVAQALPEDGEIIACDISKEFTDVGKRYWQQAGVDHKVDLRLAPAVETLDALLADNQHETFDFVFIDADKVNYQQYYEQSLKLVRKGGMIAIDNVLWFGKVADPKQQDADTKAIRALNEFLLTDERVDLTLLPIADGLTLLRKR